MLTRKQQELLLFIHQRLREDGVSPSFEEMKEALNLKSKSGAHRLIGALEEREFIRRLPNRARALEVLRLPDASAVASRPTLIHERELESNVVHGDFRRRTAVPPATTVEVPLHGRIASGIPVEAIETQQTLSVPPSMIGRGEHFALEVYGDSMIEAGILDGDYAIIRRGDTANDGEIIVALVEDQDATLKRMRRKDGMILLEPANRAYPTMSYSPRQVRVQGRLVGLMRRY